MSDAWVPARNFTPTSGRQIDLIVIHDMEAPEARATAENVAAWFGGSNAPRASAHWCIDLDSKVRCVRDIDVAWHAPGVNHNSLGYEHAGYASQSRDEWLDDYGHKMLAISAQQARIDCATYGIPIVFVDAGGLQAGQRGITTHWEVTQAFRRSTHWDPGPGFPMDHYLALVNGAPVPAPGPTPTPVPVDPGLLRRGDRGVAVRDWQLILAGARLIPRSGVDGVFGPQTEQATRAFQKVLGVTADGVVGPQTREATARLLAWIAAVSPQNPSPAVPPFLGTVRQGSRGPAVEAVQARLRDRGWNIAVDGVFGPRTEQMVRAFQADKGLAVDGVVGPVTWDALWTAPIT